MQMPLRYKWEQPWHHRGEFSGRAMGEDRSLYMCRLTLLFSKHSQGNGKDGASFHWSYNDSDQTISYDIPVKLGVGSMWRLQRIDFQKH